MISYDRLYEAKNLALEMVDGKRTDYTLESALSKMYNQKKNSLGRVYVKYCDPLNLHEYLSANLDESALDKTNFRQIAVKLSQELMYRQ